MAGKKKTFHMGITFNSPVVLSFAIICTLVLILNTLTGGRAGLLLFSVYRASLKNGFTYLRFFGHVFGHAGMTHLVNNMMMILVLGPMLEEKYGSKTLMLVIGATALVTGLVHFILFPGVALMGASGVVFAFIILSSITGGRAGDIPLTFLLVAVLYIGEQIYAGITSPDNISQLTHIIGGGVGALAGFLARRK